MRNTFGTTHVWDKVINTLYILNNSTTEGTGLVTTTKSACPTPRPLEVLQKAKNSAYKKLEGKQGCSIDEFANLLHDGGWDQPMWLIKYNGGIYNLTIATIVLVNGATWGVRVNFPVSISGLTKSIAGDGYLTSNGSVEVKNTVENVTERKLFNATACFLRRTRREVRDHLLV